MQNPNPPRAAATAAGHLATAAERDPQRPLLVPVPPRLPLCEAKHGGVPARETDALAPAPALPRGASGCSGSSVIPAVQVLGPPTRSLRASPRAGPGRATRRPGLGGNGAPELGRHFHIATPRGC